MATTATATKSTASSPPRVYLQPEDRPKVLSGRFRCPVTNLFVYLCSHSTEQFSLQTYLTHMHSQFRHTVLDFHYLGTQEQLMEFAKKLEESGGLINKPYRKREGKIVYCKRTKKIKEIYTVYKDGSSYAVEVEATRK